MLNAGGRCGRGRCRWRRRSAEASRASSAPRAGVGRRRGGRISRRRCGWHTRTGTAAPTAHRCAAVLVRRVRARGRRVSLGLRRRVAAGLRRIGRRPLLRAAAILRARASHARCARARARACARDRHCAHARTACRSTTAAYRALVGSGHSSQLSRRMLLERWCCQWNSRSDRTARSDGCTRSECCTARGSIELRTRITEMHTHTDRD